MADTPWQDDACSLVDAFRAGDRSPVEELDATLAAIEASDLNAFSHVDPERARAAAKQADLSLPFGGVPTAIKELECVEGWPDTGGSLVFKDQIADHTSHHIARLLAEGGAVPVGLTTSSEFGGLNVSVTKLNGITHNPWQHGRTVGGSSAGSSAAVAGGLLSLATGGDGGGSIRIPAGYTGLLGFKGTFGRISRAPHAFMRPNTVVNGNLSRSVRDAARYFDVTAGVDRYDPSTLPSDGTWERGLGTQELKGRTIAIVPNLGGVTLEPGVEESVRAGAEALAADTGMRIVDLSIELPNLAAQWMMGNLATLVAVLGDRWPRCADELTDEVALGVFLAQAMYNLNTAAVAEELRVQANEAMAAAFDQVDFVIAATNPGPAFAADAVTSNSETDLLDLVRTSPVTKYAARGALFTARVATAFAPKLPNALIDFAAKRFPDMVTMGALTIISNVYGNPAVSIPVEPVKGLPIGMQVLAPHHEDALLFDVALAVERERPWPMVATPVAARAAATA
ncbi:MAG: putative Amidase [Acidimicrobiales bacterium]|nr:putative Amidase [Acidimicrobiales bacterium]